MKKYYASSTASTHVGVIVLVGIVVLLVAYVLVYAVTTGPGSLESKATRSTFLTPGDDALSLQEDLKKLSEDDTKNFETELNTY